MTTENISVKDVASTCYRSTGLLSRGRGVYWPAAPHHLLDSGSAAAGFSGLFARNPHKRLFATAPRPRRVKLRGGAPPYASVIHPHCTPSPLNLSTPIPTCQLPRYFAKKKEQQTGSGWLWRFPVIAILILIQCNATAATGSRPASSVLGTELSMRGPRWLSNGFKAVLFCFIISETGYCSQLSARLVWPLTIETILFYAHVSTLSPVFVSIWLRISDPGAASVSSS